MKKLDLVKINEEITQLERDPIKNYYQLLAIYYKLAIYYRYLKNT